MRYYVDRQEEVSIFWLYGLDNTQRLIPYVYYGRKMGPPAILVTGVKIEELILNLPLI